jgi:hypothetical protein
MGEPFFCVTTGRSGSLSLALTLNQHPLLCCVHEPYTWMVKESAQRMADDRSNWVPGIAVVPVPTGPQRFGIVDHFLLPWVGELRKTFPNSRWIWLVRDGRAVVRSGVARGWYTDEERAHPLTVYQRWRWCGDQMGDVAPEFWNGMTPVERNAWYWGWCNKKIKQALDGLEPFVLRIEELAGGKLGDVQKWLGVNPMKLPVFHANVQASSGDVDVPMDEFVPWAGAMMDELYPGWRDNERVSE